MTNKKIFLKLFLILCVVFVTATNVFAFSFKENSLKFVQLSDTHISERNSTPYKMLKQSGLLLTEAINQINKIHGLDFVAFTGDMVDEPTELYYNDFLNLLTQLKYPAILIFGNHDSINRENSKGYLNDDDVQKLIREYNKNYPFEKTYYAFTPKPGFRVIGLDLSMKDDSTSNGVISSEQLQFLDNELRENQDKTVVIFQHHPVLTPFESQGHEVLNAQEYYDVIQKYKNPILIFSGHYHSTKITRQGNIVHISTPSLVTYPNAFRLVNLTSYHDRLIVDFYFYETDLEDIQSESRATTISSSAFYGKEKDRTGTMVIYKKGLSKTKRGQSKTEKSEYEEE